VKPYINELEVNEDIISYFLISEAPQVRKSKKGTDYLTLELIDRTGKIGGRVWEIPAGLDVNSLKQCLVKVRGSVTEWNDVKQLSISQIRPIVDSDEVDYGDFFERSERDPEEMYDELIQLLDSNLTNDWIKILLRRLLTVNKADFCNAPAAKSVHHNFLGGLLQHVLGLCHAAVDVSRLYKLEVNLMLAACITHDIGKIRELTYQLGVGYTLEGTLLGHISIGMQMAADAANAIDGFPQQLKITILHLIAAHHGLRDWGSPVVPAMRESVAFHLLDMLDSRIEICNKALKGELNADGLTAWVKELESPLWRGPEE
jgi:3'-5' exoribonuclease